MVETEDLQRLSLCRWWREQHCCALLKVKTSGITSTLLPSGVSSNVISITPRPQIDYKQTNIVEYDATGAQGLGLGSLERQLRMSFVSFPIRMAPQSQQLCTNILYHQQHAILLLPFALFYQLLPCARVGALPYCRHSTGFRLPRESLMRPQKQ